MATYLCSSASLSRGGKSGFRSPSLPPHPPYPPFARGGKGPVTRAVVGSRATKTRVLKSSLQLCQHQLFTHPSTVLGLHLERSGVDLRLFDPTTRKWLPTPRERAEAERERAEAERERAEAERERAEREKAERTRIEAELVRLLEENESLRGRLGKRS